MHVKLKSHKCKDYSNEHAGENVLLTVFPSETFSEFIDLPYTKKPAEAKQIVQRIEHLGNNHALYPQAALLNERTTGLEQAIVADKVAKDALKKATGEEAIARTELVHAYESSYKSIKCKPDGKMTQENEKLLTKN